MSNTSNNGGINLPIPRLPGGAFSIIVLLIMFILGGKKKLPFPIPPLPEIFKKPTTWRSYLKKVAKIVLKYSWIGVLLILIIVFRTQLSKFFVSTDYRTELVNATFETLKNSQSMVERTLVSTREYLQTFSNSLYKTNQKLFDDVRKDNTVLNQRVDNIRTNELKMVKENEGLKISKAYIERDLKQSNQFVQDLKLKC